MTATHKIFFWEGNMSLIIIIVPIKQKSLTRIIEFCIKSYKKFIFKLILADVWL